MEIASVEFVGILLKAKEQADLELILSESDRGRKEWRERIDDWIQVWLRCWIGHQG
jgi:hypothetical protein